MRKCSRCNNLRKESLFGVNSKNTPHKVCVSCREGQKIYLNNNKERYREIVRKNYPKYKERKSIKSRERRFKNIDIYKKKESEYRSRNRQKLRDYQKLLYKIQKPLKQTPEFKFKIYKNSAKRTGRIFDITFEDFLKFWQKSCHYCGDLIPTIGLDRIDNEKGYTSDNIVSCCTVCNWMKRSLPKQMFIEQCIKIFNQHYH